MRMRSNERLATRIAEDVLKRYSPTSILDIGCGDGIICESLVEDFNYRGLDIIDACIYEQKHQNSKVKYVNPKSVIHEMNKEAPWQTVLLLDVLEHTNDFTGLFREALNVASEYIVVSLPNELFFLDRLRMLVGRELPAHSLDLVGLPEGFKHQFIVNMSKAEAMLTSLARAHNFELTEEILRPLNAGTKIKKIAYAFLKATTNKNVWSMGSILIYKKVTTRK